jgi:glycosyltransferase involved in cell wall biosynthesis
MLYITDFLKKVDSKELQLKNSLSYINPKILNEKYLLYVGTIQPRKNIELLINAFKMLIEEGTELKLVIAGKKGWLYDEILNRAKALHIEDKVIFTGFIPDSEIADLYKNAQAFVLPSLYEGFGIPVLEAMYYGCPVIASNVSSIPEIGADACLYFNPKDTVELKNKILELLGNDVLRRSLIKKGSERVENFSWEKCGKETLEVLKLVAKSS